MPLPTLMPTSVQAEKFANIQYHIDGELVPVLTVELSGEQSIFFEHHIMLWKNTSIDVSLRPMKGAFKRVFAGLQVFMTQAPSASRCNRMCFGHRAPLAPVTGRDQL